MLAFLGCVCWEIREEAGKRHAHLATMLDADPSVFSKFENAVSWPTRTGIDRVVAAYAQIGDVDNAADLWVTASTRLRDYGSPPLVHPDQEPDLLAEAEAEPDALDQPDDRTSPRPEEDSDERENGDEGQKRRPA